MIEIIVGEEEAGYQRFSFSHNVFDSGFFGVVRIFVCGRGWGRGRMGELIWKYTFHFVAEENAALTAFALFPTVDFMNLLYTVLKNTGPYVVGF